MSRALVLLASLLVACSPAPPPPAPAPVILLTDAPPPPPPNPPPPELVVMLPGPSVGSVTIVTSSGDKTLDRPYEAATVNGQITTSVLPAAEVTAIFWATFDAAPRRPTVFTLFFRTGTTDLTPESTGTIQQIQTELAGRPAPDIVVIGHADRTGTDAQNDPLSFNRAESVREALRRQGIRGEIEPVGRGSRDATGDAAFDRRVEVVVR